MTPITQVIGSLTPSPDIADPASFEARANDLLVTKLPARVSEINTWKDQANTLASQINDAAEQVAEDAENTAQDVIDAGMAVVAAEEARDEAQGYAATATGAANVNGTSASSRTPAVGSLTFVYVETGKTPVDGMRMRSASRAALSTNWAIGTVAGYNAGTRTVTLSVDQVGAAPASASDWNLILEGEPGQAGADAEIVSTTLTVTGATSVVLGDTGRTAICTDAGPINPDTAASLGDGWEIKIIAAAGASATVTGVGVVPAGGMAILRCTGGTTLSLYNFGGVVGDHAIVMTTGNGHGSTADKIRRFTTTESSVGTHLVGADSSTGGFTVTVAADGAGLYAVEYLDGYSLASTVIGISVNSNQLTTGIPSITATHRKAHVSLQATVAECSTTLRLVAGDVVRAHTSGQPDSTTAATSRFSIRKIGL